MENHNQDVDIKTAIMEGNVILNGIAKDATVVKKSIHATQLRVVPAAD